MSEVSLQRRPRGVEGGGTGGALCLIDWRSARRNWHPVQGAGFRVQGSGFRVQGLGFGVQGSGFRV